MSYNGWANYPTWCVDLWLTNDEGLYNTLVSVARRGDNKHLHESLKEWVEMMLPDMGASFGSDLLQYAVDQVDWRELAEGYIEDFGIEDDEDEDDEDEDEDAEC